MIIKLKGIHNLLVLESVYSYQRITALRGSHHAKIPNIPNYPLKTLLPETRDQVAPSRPFYLTQSKVMEVEGALPWKEKAGQVERGLCLKYWVKHDL